MKTIYNDKYGWSAERASLYGLWNDNDKDEKQNKETEQIIRSEIMAWTYAIDPDIFFSLIGERHNV